MRWSPGRQSDNIEDRRGAGGGGGGLRFPGGGGKLGLGGMVILLVLSLVFKQDFFALLGGAGGGDATASAPAAPLSESADEKQLVAFISFVLDDVQSTWAKTFAAAGRQYEDAKLVLYRDETPTACGSGQSAAGPFYCPGDHKVYVDLGFYEELKSRFGAPGDFAQAYVLAHEIGHHVQNLMGTDDRVRRLQRSDPSSANPLSVRMELQADCYAGVWGNATAQRDILQQGDVEEGLAAASAVGDDRLQRMSGRRVNPDAFTHGSSEDRMRWFQQGFKSGRMDACDTFRGM